MQIAIDGPAGAGKSTVARLLADRLGVLYVDTGAMYRALTLACLEAEVPPEEGNMLTHLLSKVDIALEIDRAGALRVVLNQKDVSERIRNQDVSNAVSQYSALSSVRQKLTEAQRTIAKNQDVVMDGRDIGSVVLPDADYKFFLTASANERARRRHREWAEKGRSVDFAQLLSDIIQRDEADKNRAFAPLIQATDAVLIDSDGRTIDDVLEKILSFIQKTPK